MDWFDLLDIQGTLKSLHHSSKASILWHAAFMVQNVLSSTFSIANLKAEPGVGSPAEKKGTERTQMSLFYL